MMKNLEENFGLFELPKSEDQAKQILAEYEGGKKNSFKTINYSSDVQEVN
jgi:hypothetical protein